MSSSNMNIRASGKRQVRPPLRFSEQAKFYPTTFGVSHQPNSSESTSGTKIINDIGSGVNDSGGVSSPTVTFAVDCTETMAADIEAANTLLSLQDSPENALYQQRLEKYGMVCEECSQHSLACEQDTDNSWYCQPCWKLWTEQVLDYPEGVVEYHELKIDMSNPDSWYPEVTDNIVFAEEIYGDEMYTGSNCCSIGERAAEIKEATMQNDLSSDDTQIYLPNQSDQYAIVLKVEPIPGSSSYASSPVYLITSTGTLYPIEGSEDPNSIEYNPIIFEVVENLKRTLNGNTYDYDEI